MASSRIYSLDGLRGVAAVAVLLGHARIIYIENGPGGWMGLDGVRQLLNATGPWGFTAVWLFFILSGFVLAWSFTRNAKVDYGVYILRRLARLYIPVWGAVVLAVVTMLFVSRADKTLGDWAAGHPAHIELRHVVSDLTLVGGIGSTITPLWSLRWEVFFSVLLILYVLVARKINPWVLMIACYGLSIVGNVIGNQVLMYMPMFGIGVAFAFAWGSIQQISLRVAGWFGRVPFAAGALAVLALLAATSLQSVHQILPSLGISTTLPSAATFACRLLSVALIVVIVGVSKTVGKAFTLAPIAWLGKVSFSLYLVHEIVLLVGVYATKADTTALVVSVLLCFPVAWLFYKLVEEPAHNLSKRIGARSTEAVLA